MSSSLADVSHTLPSVRRDFVEWHRGRAPFVLWALDFDLAPVRARVARAAACLGDYLLAGYCRQPHVTLDLCGFPSPQPMADDEFDAAFLGAQVETLAALAPSPFVVELAGLESFPSAAYLALRDAEGGVAAVRAALAGASGHRLLGDYVAHVTVGLYRAAWPAEAVLAVLRSDDGAPLAVAVERVSLMAYAPSEIGGRLAILADFHLATRHFAWRGVPLPGF